MFDRSHRIIVIPDYVIFQSCRSALLFTFPSHITKASRSIRYHRRNASLSVRRCTTSAVRHKRECFLLICILCVRDHHNHRARSRTHACTPFCFSSGSAYATIAPIASYNFLFTCSSICNQQHNI